MSVYTDVFSPILYNYLNRGSGRRSKSGRGRMGSKYLIGNHPFHATHSVMIGNRRINGGNSARQYWDYPNSTTNLKHPIKYYGGGRRKRRVLGGKKSARPLPPRYRYMNSYQNGSKYNFSPGNSSLNTYIGGRIRTGRGILL